MTPAENYASQHLDAVQIIRQHAPEQLQEQLIDLIHPIIVLSKNELDDAQIATGASKFGGSPDVPEGFEWPMWDETIPLNFLAQINLVEIARFDIQNVLPHKGILSFFYGIKDAPCEGIYRIYWLEDTEYRRFSEPPTTSEFKTCQVGFSTEMEMGNTYDYLEWEDFQEVLQSSMPPISNPCVSAPIKMLGLPDYPFTTGASHSIPQNHSHLRRLLQIDSFFIPGMCWCDAGTLSFLIGKEDLDKWHFTNAYAGIDAG